LGHTGLRTVAEEDLSHGGCYRKVLNQTNEDLNQLYTQSQEISMVPAGWYSSPYRKDGSFTHFLWKQNLELQAELEWSLPSPDPASLDFFWGAAKGKV